MDGVAGDDAVNHILQEVNDLLSAWNDPSSAQTHVVRSAATIRSWLARLCFHNATRALFVSDLLMKLAQSHITLSVTSDQKIVPSTKDRVISALDHHEHSIQFWVLDCIAAVLTTVDERDSIQEDLDEEIPPNLIKYCFSRLSLAYSVPVQSVAGRCLGALSKLYLESIVDLILSEMKTCTSDTQIREFVIVQRAVSCLDFSLRNLAVTIKYLEELISIMSKIDRGVLRSEICLSLKIIVQRMLGGEQKEILEKGSLSIAFWNVFARLYRLVGKWAKKAKHAVFCYSFMITCVCVGQTSFFTSSNREDVFKLVMNGLRKDDLRVGCIAVARDYISGINPSFFRDDTELFNNQLYTLVANVLPKKKAILESELSIITEILVAVGRKHMHYLVNEIAASVLKPKSGFTDSSKCALLSSLIIIANEIPSEMETYNYTLGPLDAAIIEGDSEPTLLCSALLCFPAIAHSKWDRVKMTGAYVASLTLNPNHDIAASASGALHRFALRDPQTNLLLSLYQLIDVLTKIFQDDLSTQIRIMNNVKVMLASYDELIILNGSPTILVPYECWIAVRHHLEGICILWLLHPEAWVRKEASSLLQILGYSGIRQLDRTPSDFGSNSVNELKTKDKLNLLVDCLILPPNQDADLSHCPELHPFLSTYYDQFEGVIAWVWSIVCVEIPALIDKDKLVDTLSEAYPYWKNQFTFLCLSLRIKPVPSNEFTTESYRQDYQTRKESLQFLRQCFVCLHLSSSDLVAFAQHVSSLLRLPSEKIWKEARRALMMLDASTYDALAQQLKLPFSLNSPVSAASTLKKRIKRNLIEEYMDYFFHERTVELYERVLLNVEVDTFNSFEFIPLHISDFVAAWMSSDNQSLIEESKPGLIIAMLFFLKAFCVFFTAIRDRVPFTIGHIQITSERQNLQVESNADQTVSDPSLDLCEMLFSFIASVAFPKVIAERKEDVKNSGLIAACQAVTALLDMGGPFSNDRLFTSVMKWLSQLGLHAQSCNLLSPSIAQALTAVLAHHPFQLLDFLVQSCNGSSSTDHFLHAVCNNLSLKNPNRSAFIDKVAINEFSFREHAGMLSATHPCTILVASLLCQISFSPQIRKRGLQLCKLTEPEFGTSVATKPLTHDSMDMCIQMAYEVSANVAKKYRMHSAAFLDAVSFFAYNLPDPLAAILFEFCNPWIGQFSDILEIGRESSMDSEHCEVGTSNLSQVFKIRMGCGHLVWQTLDSLLHFTKVIRTSFTLEHQIRLLWEHLGNQDHQILPAVLFTFLELQFRQYPDLCTRVYLYLMRSAIGQQLATLQLGNVKCFQDSIPIQEISTQCSKLKSVESVVNWDPTIVSLLLLTDVIFERPEFVRSHLPLILHSACVLQIASLPNLLMFTLIDLGITPKSNKPYDSKSFANAVLNKSPLFAKQWCRLAFDWALYCPDKTVADRSLDFYCLLNVWFDLRIGMHISMQIQESLHEQNVAVLAKCVNIFSLIPCNRVWTGQEWTLYIVLGFSLLSHRFLPVFQLGLQLMEKCWRIPNVPESEQIINDLKPLWEFSSVHSVTAKGFTAEATFAPTLQVLLMISRAIPRQSSIIDVIITVTMLAMMIELESKKFIIEDSHLSNVLEHLHKVRPSACECMENLHRVIVAICSGSAEDMHAVRRNSLNHRSSAQSSTSHQSIISTMGRASVQGSRRISKKSIITNQEFNIMQNKDDLHSVLPDAVLSVDDLLNIVPELCHRSLRESQIETSLFCIELLQDVLSSNQAAWRKPCLWLLDAMLDEMHFEISARHFAKLGKILSFYCHDPDMEVATTAEIVCAALFDKYPAAYHNGAFKFVHVGNDDIQGESTLHFDNTCSDASFQECIRFFDGPVSSLIQGLSTLYTPVFIDKSANYENERRPGSQDFNDYQSQYAESEHRGSIETIPVEIENTYASSNQPSSNVLDILVEKSPLTIDECVDEDSFSSLRNSFEASAEYRRQSLPVFGLTSSTLTSLASDRSLKDGLRSDDQVILPPLTNTTTTSVIARDQDQSKWPDYDSGSEGKNISSHYDDTNIGDDGQLDSEQDQTNAARTIPVVAHDEYAL